MLLEVEVLHEPGVIEIVTQGPMGPPGPPGPGLADFVVGEQPSGLINGTNMVFTTANGFSLLWVYLNGLRMTAGIDYNVTGGNSFTFTFAPWVGSILRVDYVESNT